MKKTKRTFCPYSEALSIGILYDEGESQREVQFLKRQLMWDNKKIFWIMRVKKHEKHKQYNRPYYHSGDVSFTGKIQPGYLSKFTKLPMDMLIVLEEDPDTLTQYVLSHSGALKIGCFKSRANIGLLDFIIRPSGNASKCGELINYLRKVA